MPRTTSRRTLMRAGAVGTAGLALSPLVRSARGALGANDRIRLAVAGLNWRGGDHIESFSPLPNVELVYIVDPDKMLWDGRIKLARDKSDGRSNPKAVQDIRRVLDDKTIDAISIATPNHWHVLMTIWGCQAGKDVYVEKPLSHNIHEGRVAVQAARRYDRVVQHGTQRRSDPGWAKVVAAIHSGQLGKLKVARGLCYNAQDGFRTRASIGYKPHKTPPPELDFDLWLGPARRQPYHENLVHYRWHWFWEFGNGDTGNQGVHQMDVARWGIADATLPKRVISFGGRLGYLDQADAASTLMTFMDFGATQLIFETRGLPSPAYHGLKVGNIFHLEAGTIVEQKFYPNDGSKPAPLPDVAHSRGPGKGPFENFIAAMRSRKQCDLNADVLEGHYSASLCHLANMSIRLGSKVPFTPRTDVFDVDSEARDVLERTEPYLIKNGMKLEDSGYTLGRSLTVDAKTETIVGDREANAMLTRYYRDPFVVPDRIA